MKSEKLQLNSLYFLIKHWPVFFIVLLWFVFSSPFFLQGKIPFAGDYQVNFFAPWSQYPQLGQPIKNSAMPDVIDQIYPWKSLVINEWKTGQIPLWNPYNFAGTPLLANYQSAVLSPMNILFFLLPFKISWGLLILFQPLLAGLGIYFYVRKISVSQIGGAISSIAFMFCGFIVCWMGYGTLGYAIGIMPWILLGIEGYYLSKKYTYLLLISFGLVFSFVSGHFQISLYTFFLSFAYFLFRYLPSKSGKVIVFGFVAFLSGLLLSLPQLLPSMEFYLQSLRSTLFERPEVIPWQYFLTVIAPDFFGNPVTGNDWFGHYAEWNGYIGLIPFLFAIFSLTLVKGNKFVRFFSLTALCSILFATPTVFGDAILYAHIPVLATSAAGRIIVVYSFSFAVLAGIGLDHWIETTQKKKLTLGFLSLLSLLVGWIVIAAHLGLPIDKVSIAKQNFLLPSLFLGSLLVGSAAVYLIKNKKILIILSFVFLILSSFDLYRFAQKWQTFSPQSLVFPEIGVTKFFPTMHNERSLGNYGGQVSLYYQLPSVEGYDALYPQRFGEFAHYVAVGTIGEASRSLVEFPKNGTYAKQAINLLGVKFIVAKISDFGKVWEFPYWQQPNVFQQVYRDDGYIVLENKNAFPKAFIAGNYEVKTNPQDILSSLFAGNTRQTLILEENPGIKKNSYLESRTDITSYTPNKVTLHAQTNKDGLLFLSDTYYPGWKATVDGKETKIYRADYAFRAIVIPKGTHTVVFSYEPSSFTYGILGSILGIGVLAGAYFFQKRRV